MANIYDQNVKLQAIADAIDNQSITITTGQDLLDALADIAAAMQPAAANISYDNTNSGLQAVNVQQAVDENADNISTLNSSLSAINYNGYGSKVDVSLGSYYTIPSNGILVCSSNANSVGTAWCVEGNFGFVVSGSSANSNSACIPVFSGQRWSFTMSSGTGSVMFVPYSV